jgi:hypothetical protein
MSEEDLPLPINPDTSDIVITASLIGVNSSAIDNTKDLFFFGRYVSSGTKYAAIYRDVATGRLKYGYTSTEPGTTVTGLTALDFQIAGFYNTQVNISSQSTLRLAQTNVSSAIVSNNLPFTTSYGQLYFPIVSNSQTYPVINTWYPFTSRWTNGGCTSDWSVTSSDPGYGLKYTGANAIVEIICYVGYTVGGFKYTTVAVGSGVPSPGFTPSFSTLTGATSLFRLEENLVAYGLVRFLTTINTNDSVVPYTAANTTATAVLRAGHVLVRVRSYV